MANTKTWLGGASLKEKVVLLVSVAQDLGYESAILLAKQGCRIMLIGRSSQIDTAAHNIKALGFGAEV